MCRVIDRWMSAARPLCSLLILVGLGWLAACDSGRPPTATTMPTAPSGESSGPPGPGPASPGQTPRDPVSLPDSYYVDPSGNDEADGRTPATAFATIGRALDVVVAGQTVRIRPGTYTESTRVSLHGQSGRPIRVTGDGGRPVLSGGRRLSFGLWLEDSEHVTVDNIEIRDFTDIGLVAVLSRGVQLGHLVVHHNGFRPTIGWVEGYGLHLDESTEVTVEASDVHHNGPDPRTPTTVGTGINCFAIHDSIIRNNRSHGNNGGGILIEDSTNVLVEGNQIDGNDLDVSVDEWWDGGIWLDGGRQVTIRNNVLRENLGPGIEISDEDRQAPTGYVLENNVSTGNYFGIFIWNFGTTSFPPPSILQRSGNQFTGNSRRDVWIEPWR